MNKGFEKKKDNSQSLSEIFNGLCEKVRAICGRIENSLSIGTGRAFAKAIKTNAAGFMSRVVGVVHIGGFFSAMVSSISACIAGKSAALATRETVEEALADMAAIADMICMLEFAEAQAQALIWRAEYEPEHPSAPEKVARAA